MPHITVSTRIEAPAQRVWDVLADLGSIYKWNPGVMKSYALSAAKSGEGAERHCDLNTKGDYLKERAVDWREGEGFKIEVYDTNLPLKRNVVSFTLHADGDGSLVTVSPAYDLKFGPAGVLMDLLFVRRQIRAGMEGLVAGLKYHVETGELVGDVVPAT